MVIESKEILFLLVDSIEVQIFPDLPSDPVLKLELLLQDSHLIRVDTHHFHLFTIDALSFGIQFRQFLEATPGVAEDMGPFWRQPRGHVQPLFVPLPQARHRGPHDHSKAPLRPLDSLS